MTFPLPGTVILYQTSPLLEPSQVASATEDVVAPTFEPVVNVQDVPTVSVVALQGSLLVGVEGMVLPPQSSKVK